MVNTSWDIQGVPVEPGFCFDLRYEYIRQVQPMAGSRKVNPGEIPRHHDELKAVNRNPRPGPKTSAAISPRESRPELRDQQSVQVYGFVQTRLPARERRAAHRQLVGSRRGHGALLTL